MATAKAAIAQTSSRLLEGLAMRILLVEDLVLSQELACTILRRAGHLVEIANDGIEAVAAVKANSYDLVLMDIEMPRMDGFTSAREIRDLPGAAGQTPIVAMTAVAMPEQVRAYRQAGMDGYVAKPFQQQELLFAASDAPRLRRDRASSAPSAKTGLLAWLVRTARFDLLRGQSRDRT